MRTLTFYPLSGFPEFTEGMDLSALLRERLEAQNIQPQEGDILVVTHKALSKVSGQVRDLATVSPSPQASALAERTGKDPRLAEVILSSAERVYACDRGIVIAERWDGWICCNAGVDASNAGGMGRVILLPEDCDRCAREISRILSGWYGFPIPVIICDTHGRALRSGTAGVTVGSFGLEPIRRYTGKTDRNGRRLLSTQEAVADELAGAATLVMGQGDEGVPAVLIRGFVYTFAETDATALRLPREQRLYHLHGTYFEKE